MYTTNVACFDTLQQAESHVEPSRDGSPAQSVDSTGPVSGIDPVTHNVSLLRDTLLPTVVRITQT